LKSTKSYSLLFSELLIYLLFLSIPLSRPLSRITVKLLAVSFLLLLLFRVLKPRLERVDLIALLMPTYQLFASLIRGEFFSFVRSPNGLTPNLAYLVRFFPVKVERALQLFLLGALLLGLSIILQSILGAPNYKALLEGKFHFLKVVRPWKTFVGHPLTAGALISIGFFLSIALYFREKKFYYLFSSFVLLAGLVFTFDRSYWVAVSLILLVSLLFLKRWKLFLVIFLALSVSLWSVPQLKKRFLSIFELKNSSNRYRVAMWKGALNYYAGAPLDRKLFGTGREGYRKELKEPVYRAEKELRLRKRLYSHLHSDYVTVLIWYGLVGLVVFLFTFFYFLFVNLKAFWETGDFLYYFFAAAYGVILVGGLFEYNFEDEAVKFAIYALFGLNARLLSEKGAP